MRAREQGNRRLGERMRAFRKAHRQTQEEVAAQMHIHADKLRRFEQGGQMPSLDELLNFCTVLNLEGSESDQLLRLSTYAKIGDRFELMAQRSKSDLITPYQGLGWGTVLSLQDYPLKDGRLEGWRMADVELRHDAKKCFRIPRQYEHEYQQFYEQYFDEKRFFDNRWKVMLIQNPIAFSDTPTLLLQTKSCLFSEVQFHIDRVATIPARRDALIEELMRGSLKAKFAHAITLHLVVLTRDRKILLAKRSPKVAHHPGVWSCSVEEQLSQEDVSIRPRARVLTVGERLLDEELSLKNTDYHTDNLRLLSVFLKADELNISLCGCAELDIDSGRLSEILRGKPRADYEFTEWLYLDLRREELLRELTHPTRYYHPTGGYRLLLTFLKYFGVPTHWELVP